MPVPSLITDLTTVAATNSPAGTESAKGTVDNYFRAHAAFIRQIYDQTLGPTVNVAAAATTNIGFAGSANVSITGTTTITAFDTYAEGALRYAVFTGALTLTHNATSLILPGNANIVTAAGDAALFKSLGGGNWKCLFFQRLSESVTAYLPLAGGTMTGQLAINANVRGVQITNTVGSPEIALIGGAGSKAFRVSGNTLEIVNNTYSSVIMSLTDAGNLSAPVITQTSDERQKCKWIEITDAQLEALANMKLAGTFQWIDSDERSCGGSAQEIQAILPEAVYTDEKGNLSVNYGGLNFAILQAMLKRAAK